MGGMLEVLGKPAGEVLGEAGVEGQVKRGSEADRRDLCGIF